MSKKIIAKKMKMELDDLKFISWNNYWDKQPSVVKIFMIALI